MIPSLRFLKLLALGLVPALLAGVSPAFYYVTVVYGLGLVLLLGVDTLLGVGREAVTVQRRPFGRLSLGAENPIRLAVCNHTPQRLHVWGIDDFPPAFRAVDAEFSLLLGPYEEREWEYRLIPPARGAYSFGDLHLRVQHGLGLTLRRMRIPAEEEARVYPNLKGVEKYALLARRNRLSDLGLRTARPVGQGREFERLREYAPDDDYRQIDWKATAKRHKPISRVYQTERSQNVMICIDAGRMMAAKVGELSKLDHAINAGLMLAYVAVSQGDNVGLTVFSDAVHLYLPPKKGKPQFTQCLNALYDVQPALVYVDYKAALKYLALRNKRRSLIVLFTDLFDEATASGLAEYVALLRPTHLPLCVTLNDANVVQLAAADPQRDEDLYSKAAALELLHERKRLLDQLVKQGVFVLDKTPEEISVAAVNKYLELKARQLL